ncbi:hypothetical protein [Rheinheimera sp.]|uniref:hypothetical protein n=1 Tax=Rheinheimera sp. TaxID=1869214 RepID=UPI004047BE5A
MSYNRNADEALGKPLSVYGDSPKQKSKLVASCRIIRTPMVLNTTKIGLKALLRLRPVEPTELRVPLWLVSSMFGQAMMVGSKAPLQVSHLLMIRMPHIRLADMR